MTNSEIDAIHAADKRATVAVGAGLLILLGAALQWIDVLCAHFLSQNSWFFATLFGEAWNMIDVWLSAALWHQDLQYWPLLLVITGAAILFSNNRERAIVAEGAPAGARRDA